MGREEQIVKERMNKVIELINKDINPYAYKYDQKNFSQEIKEKFAKLKNDQRTKEKAKIAGRVITIRDIGKLIFATIQDSQGRIQIILQKEETEKNSFELFKKYIDSGDFIGCEGIIMKSRTGEISILAKKIELLSKSLLPLPEKWHGIQDKEERYRKRYLDLTINAEVKKVFLMRTQILDSIREFMRNNKFVEIETPLLQACYGGACAKPFMTHCDAFDSTLFLSIAPELYLKKALVGGFERVYEITKKFRNEGVDRQHNPEHMTIEWYQAYADYEDGMKLFEDLIKTIAKKLFGTLTFEYQGNKIDLRKWQKISLLDAIKKYLKEDITKVKDDEDAKKIAKKHGIDPKCVTKINLPDELMKLFREKLIQPTFLIDYPIELAPLAKPKRGDSTKAEVFQPFIGGMELARAYSELNDPALQGKNFLEQECERKKGNQEAMPADKDFITALEHGMPPACGVGIGIERLVMLFANQSSIRDVILFPFMKPIEEKEEIKIKEKATKKK
jgi:lysyl-tRNA synthetase class 2